MLIGRVQREPRGGRIAYGGAGRPDLMRPDDAFGSGSAIRIRGWDFPRVSWSPHCAPTTCCETLLEGGSGYVTKPSHPRAAGRVAQPGGVKCTVDVQKGCPRASDICRLTSGPVDRKTCQGKPARRRCPVLAGLCSFVGVALADRDSLHQRPAWNGLFMQLSSGSSDRDHRVAAPGPRST